MLRVAILLVCIVAPLAADSVLLKSGLVIQGRIVSQDAEALVIETTAGRRTLRKPDVMRIRYGDAPLPAGPIGPIMPAPVPVEPVSSGMQDYAAVALELGAGAWTSAFSEYWSQYRFFVVTDRGQTPRPGDFTLRGPDQNGDSTQRGIYVLLNKDRWMGRLRHRFLRSQPEHTLYQGVDAPLTETQTLAVHPISLSPLTRQDSNAELSRIVHRASSLSLRAGGGYRVIAQRARLIRDGVSASLDLAAGTGSSSIAWNIDNNIRHRSAGPSVHGELEYRLTDRIYLGLRPGLYRLHGSWGLKEENALIPGAGFVFGNELEGSTAICGRTLDASVTWLIRPDLALKAGIEIDSARIVLKNVRMSGAYSVRWTAAGIAAAQIDPMQAVTDSVFLNGPFFTDHLRRREEMQALVLTLEKRFSWQ
jgi:hypothetical protein